MVNEQVLTVGQLTAIVDEVVGLIPPGLVVEGEIQKVRIYKDYMVFFELNGEGKSINCFSTLSELAGEVPEEGHAYQLVGELQLGQKTELRFRVRKINSSAGVGNAAKKFEELKLKLRSEGFFDDARKRGLPKFPKRVAVVTSGSSSAWEDFKRISSSRFVATDLELFSVTVQGPSAEQEICSALAKIQQRSGEFDAIAVVRGGGARGDLEAFNSEKIARSIFESKIPVVSGVGHEDDVSLVDLVADIRASTPSNAAEIIFPDSKNLLKEIAKLKVKATDALNSLIKFKILDLESLHEDLNHVISRYLSSLDSKVELAQARLGSLDFEKTFGRGWAILELGGEPLKSVKQAKVGSEIEAILTDGKLKLEIKKLIRSNYDKN